MNDRRGPRRVAGCCAHLGVLHVSDQRFTAAWPFHLSGSSGREPPTNGSEYGWHGQRTENGLANAPFPPLCCAPCGCETTTNANFDTHAAQDSSIISTTDGTWRHSIGVGVIRSQRTNCSACASRATRSRCSARRRLVGHSGDVRRNVIPVCCRDRHRFDRHPTGVTPPGAQWALGRHSRKDDVRLWGFVKRTHFQAF